MPLYEHVFLARQDVSTQQAETMMKEYQTIIETNGGKVTKSEYWGLKPLAFKVKKSRKAHYALFNIDAPHAAVAEMERNMGISVDVLRFITIRVDEHETEPSAMMRKSDREERRPGGFGGPGGGGGRGNPDSLAAKLGTAKNGLTAGMSPADPTVRAYTEVKSQLPKAIADMNAAIAKATTLSTALAKYNVTLTVPAPVKMPEAAAPARRAAKN